MFKTIAFILINLITSVAYSAETCSRIAIINYQEVLVDAGSNKKGEGLRYYLEKDANSQKLLDEYQEKNKPTVLGAATSTLGSFMILSGLMQTNESSGIQNKNTLIFGGGILVALSYLTSKTMQYNNEVLLKRSVDQYNKRNLPRIYLSPGDGKGFGVGITQEF
jgi:hypothetical protein